MDQANPLGDYQQFVEPRWTPAGLEKLTVVARFLQALRSMNFERLLSEYGDHPYLQHNVAMADGIPGVVNEGRRAAKRFPEFSIDTKHVYVDGDFVIIHSHMTTKAAHRGNERRGVNVIDIWRVEDAKIVEHWDSIQPLGFMFRLLSLLAGGAVRNTNGRF